MRESTIEAHLKARVKAVGGLVRKVQFIAHSGAPDRLVLLPGRHFFVELKAPGEKAKPHQEREHARLRLAGFAVYIIDSIEGVDALIEG